MPRILLLVLTLVITGSCRKDPGLVDKPLQDYLNAFVREASERGIMVDYLEKPIEARLEFHENDIRLGWCNYNSDQPNLIVINTLFWEIFNDLEREKLVFHELGHCILNRPHLDEKGEDGHCLSIMHSGQTCADNYTSVTRDTYLDELFLQK